MSVVPADTSYVGRHRRSPGPHYAQGPPPNMPTPITRRRLSDSWAPSPGASSDYSSCSEESSPSPTTPLNASSSLFPEDSWNLIPYNVPWGEDYYDYRPGVLPGPEGACVFLRSPTPLKNKRTVKACNKCRGRKAKCTGTRPACARCLSRGYLCEYDPDDAKDNKGPSLSRKRLRDKATSSCSSSVCMDPTGTIPMTAELLATYSPPLCYSPKQEEVDMTWYLGSPEGPSRENASDSWAPQHRSTRPHSPRLASTATQLHPVIDSASYSWAPQHPPTRPHSPRFASTAVQQHLPGDASGTEPQAVYYDNTSPNSDLSDVESMQSGSSWIHAPQPVKCFTSFSPAAEDPTPSTFDPPQEDATAGQTVFFAEEQSMDVPQASYFYYTQSDLPNASYSYELTDNNYAQLPTAYLPTFVVTDDYAGQHYGVASSNVVPYYSAASSNSYVDIALIPAQVGIYE